MDSNITPASRYTHRYSITAADMNKEYRLSPHAVLLYFQDAFARFMGCLHFAAFDLAKYNKMWVITEFSMHTTPADVFWTEDIDVTIWFSEVTSLRVYSEFRVCKTDGTQIASGYGSWTILNIATRHLETTDCLVNLPIDPERTTVSHRKLRFPQTDHRLVHIEHTVNYSDLDFNGHVNNRSYLNIAMQTASNDFLARFYADELVIHWLHETYLNEVMDCDLYEAEPKEFINLLRKKDGTPVAQVYSRWLPVTSTRKIDDSIERV